MFYLGMETYKFGFSEFLILFGALIIFVWGVLKSFGVINTPACIG